MTRAGMLRARRCGVKDCRHGRKRPLGGCDVQPVAPDLIKSYRARTRAHAALVSSWGHQTICYKIVTLSQKRIKSLCGAKPPQKLRWTNAGRWGGLWRFHPGHSLSRLVDREVFATLPLIER